MKGRQKEKRSTCTFSRKRICTRSCHDILLYLWLYRPACETATISMGKDPLRLTSGSGGTGSRLPTSLFHLSHVPLSFPSVDTPVNISGPPLLRLLKIFLRFRGLLFTLFLLNRSRRNSDMSAGTDPRRGDSIPETVLSKSLLMPLLLLPPVVLLLLLLLFIGKFSRSPEINSMYVENAVPLRCMLLMVALKREYSLLTSYSEDISHKISQRSLLRKTSSS